MSDGLALNAPRDDVGASVRLLLDGVGHLDITNHGPNGNGQSVLDVNGEQAAFSGSAPLGIALIPTLLRGAPTYTCAITGFGAGMILVASPVAFDNADIISVQNMEAAGIIPYRNVPNGGKSKAQIQALADQYFPFDANNYEIALSVYDWTTADFFRMDLFNLYRYTALPSFPLDNAQIAMGIWTADWGSYKPSNSDFMNSFMMTPASSMQDVEAQLSSVADRLGPLLQSLRGLTVASMKALPRISTIRYPALYSGQVSIQNLGKDAVAVYFEEYPGNAGPVGVPMGKPIAEALNGFMATGSTLTFKSFTSFTNDQAGAMHYSNGIMLSLTPLAGATWGEQITYITPLSDEADKVEYTLLPGSQVTVTGHRVVPHNGTDITVIDLTLA
ncbi:MAG: hypothetical protein O7G83_06590 [Proteobacteria bacterium]|nr:hypothetical protein [Pseudomonadota bacterium]